MKLSILFALLAPLISKTAANPIATQSLDQRPNPSKELLNRRDQSCENTATNRTCWGDYSIEDDWYTITPDTGVTREYWLVVENTTLAPDGYERQVLTFNGSLPGPTIIADWGDNVIVHVTNNLQNNGTSIHMHGISQPKNSQYDGVPGATQCPIAPGESFTYKFRATQYGTTWYHSHFSLQYSDGLLGGLIINGPATANYDEDLGTMMLSDWFHETAFSLWDYAQLGVPPVPENGIINGTNTFDCSSVDDAACLGTGARNEIVFVSGTTYRLRLINTAIEGFFRFHIDNHNFTVIAMDLVPIVPYTTDSLVIANGQRYDIIITADQTEDNYWLRAIYHSDCTSIDDSKDNIKGIIRYDASSTADPTSTSPTYAAQCHDEDASDLVPYVAKTVGSVSNDFNTELSYLSPDSVFQWTINSSSLIVNWSEPTLVSVYNNLSLPTSANVWEVTESDGWVYFAISDESGTSLGHPLHLHGHDFYILATGNETYDAATTTLNLVNPPRRDTATLPGDGFLVIAFESDNPGAWLMHCHIAWHASEGMGIQFLERESEIVDTFTDFSAITDGCASWDAYTSEVPVHQDESGV